MIVLSVTSSKSNSPGIATTVTNGEHVFLGRSPQFPGLPPLTTGAYVITATVPANPIIASEIINLQGITVSAKDTWGLGASFFNYQRDVTAGTMTVTPSLSEFGMLSLGMQIAKMLVFTLDQIKVYNRLAIYPIVSILKPYLEEAEELILDMSLISSIPSIASVIDRETAESRDADVQGESFFRFLDELESGAYAADDITDDE